ncbi:hypothetical protein UlMin_003000 [Ulmus minor]
MASSKEAYALFLICMLFISSTTPILGCPYCGEGSPPPKHKTPPKSKSSPPKGRGPITLPPVTLPPIVKPPVTLPPVILPPIKPPVTLPPVTLPPIKPPVTLPPVALPPIKPPVTLPPVTLPPIKPPVTLPPVTLPPIVKPPVTLPPVTIPPITTNPPSGGSPAKGCPPPPSKDTCPIDTLKLGACVDLLGGLVHVGLGDPAVNQCCPILQGLVGAEAAVCLCTTLKIKALNLNIFVPIALQLLITCGKTPPSGFTCTL